LFLKPTRIHQQQISESGNAEGGAGKITKSVKEGGRGKDRNKLWQRGKKAGEGRRTAQKGEQKMEPGQKIWR